MECGLSLAQAREVSQKQNLDSVIPGWSKPFACFILGVTWIGHKFINYFRPIKDLYFTVNYPVETVAGYVLSECTPKWITLAARIICVIRPLIYFAQAGKALKDGTEGLVTRVLGDTETAKSYETARGTWVDEKSKTGYTVSRRSPMFTQRFRDAIVNIICAGVHWCDVYEALTADSNHLVARCLPELKLTIDTIGKAQLIQAIEYYTPLINDILQKSNTKLDVNTIKEIVEKASSVTDETAGTVLKTIDVLVRGVLGIKLGGKVETG